jgi:subtilisin family serine protease
MRRRSQWFARLLVALGLALCLGQMPAARADAGSVAYVPNEVIVRLLPPLLGSVETLVSNLAARFGLRVLDRLDGLPVFRLQILNNLLSAPALATLLDAVPGVLYAEPNFIGQSPASIGRASWAAGGDEGTYHDQWAPAVLRLTEAHAVSQGAGVVVAVLDTGVDRDHPQLAGQLLRGYDFVDFDADPSEEGTHEHDVAYGHGTHVAGLVALAAPQASILPLRILRPDGTGTSWLLAQGLRYAVGAPVAGLVPSLEHADVINISYSVQQRSLLIDDVLGLLMALPDAPLVVAAAGNRGPSTAKEYPAGEGLPGVLAVAASGEDDTLADFSTRGTWVDVAAPGVDILSSVPDDAYGVWSGTSMAAPLTAGVAALVRARYPDLSPRQVAERIVDNATAIEGPVPCRVDAAAALGLAAAP